MTWSTLPDPAVATALGKRIKAIRLDRKLSQLALAKHSGVSLRTVQSLETAVRHTSLLNLLRVLRSLRRLDNLDAALAPPTLSPIELASRPAPARKRAPRTPPS